MKTVKRVDSNTFQIELELIEPPGDYALVEACGPVAFIAGIEKGTIPLIFTFQLTMRKTKTGYVEVGRGSRWVTWAERKAYLSAYRAFCQQNNPHLRKIFFVLPECVELKEGAVVIKEGYFEQINKQGDNHG